MTIDEIRARRAAIDGAPWTYYQPSQWIMGRSAGGGNLDMKEYRVADLRGWGHLQYRDGGAALQDANGQFIAHAPQDVDTLLSLVDTYRGEYSRAVDAASVFQSGGPLAHLLRLGDSTVIDGPHAALCEIRRLNALVEELRARAVKSVVSDTSSKE